ncbi:MAG: hypothetical protein WC683_07450 [bacterium]
MKRIPFLLLLLALLVVPVLACWHPPPPPPPPSTSGPSSGMTGTWTCGDWARAGWQDHGDIATIDPDLIHGDLWLVVEYPNGGRLQSIQTSYASDPSGLANLSEGMTGLWYQEPRGFVRQNALAGRYLITNPMGLVYILVEKRQPSPTPLTISLERVDGLPLWVVETSEQENAYTVHLRP